MNREEVKTSENTKPTGIRLGLIVYRSVYNGMNVMVGSLFDGDKLVHAGYLMQDSHEAPGKYFADYDKAKKSLLKNTALWLRTIWFDLPGSGRRNSQNTASRYVRAS